MMMMMTNEFPLSWHEVQGLQKQVAVHTKEPGSSQCSAILIEAVVGTCWILVALLRVAELRRSVVNVFVISLCINDLCTLFFVVVVIIDSYVWRRWRAGDIMCRLNPELCMYCESNGHVDDDVT